MIKIEELNLTREWDKTFPKSEKTDHCKVTFVNRYGITLAADMYVPKSAGEKPDEKEEHVFSRVENLKSHLKSPMDILKDLADEVQDKEDTTEEETQD